MSEKIIIKHYEDDDVLIIEDNFTDFHNLGWYATELALNTAYPTATAWDWAVVWTTDSVWIWDTDTNTWVDSWETALWDMTKVVYDSAWVEEQLLWETATQTVTNKDIDADSNTISNISSDELKSTFITNLTEKVTPVDDDIFIIQDSEDSNAFKKVKKSSIWGWAWGLTLDIWYNVTGTYASSSTFTFTGTEKDSKQIVWSLFTCTDSAGTTRRIGYVKSASESGGTVTVTVVTDTDLVSWDLSFNIAPNRKVRDYLHLISIPWEAIADASNSQWVWSLNITRDSYILPVDSAVRTASVWAGASCAWNIYKDTTALYSSAPDLTTNAILVEQRPTTNTISAWEDLSLRITASAWATNKASDFQARCFVVEQEIFTSLD